MNFSEVLAKHPKAARYDVMGKQIKELIDVSASKVENFSKLKNHPTLALLSKIPGKSKLQVTHHHEVLGDPFFGEDFKLVGLLGLGAKPAVVEFDDKDDPFQTTGKNNAPSISSLLNLTEKKEIGEVLTTGRGENVEKHAIQSVVLLPPKLTNILRSFKVLDPSLLLLKFVEFIRSELQMKQNEREMD